MENNQMPRANAPQPQAGQTQQRYQNPQQNTQRPQQPANRAPQQQRPPEQGQQQRAPQQRAPQQAGQMGGQRPPQQVQQQGQGMPQQPQQGVERQIVIRTFLPDMPYLKDVAKQLTQTPNIKIKLYGQGGEVVVVLTARARTSAAAIELAENAAAKFENAMGDCAYGRGKAHFGASIVEEMLHDETTLAAPDEETGFLIEQELKQIRDAEKVFDFGQNSFRHSRMADKIADAALMDDEESDDPVQLAADRSYAAAKCTKSDFGVAIAGTQGSNMVCAAVTYGKVVYVRCIRPAADANKAAVYTIFDIIRRLTLGMTIPYARTFKAGQEIDWNSPIQAKAGKGSKGKSSGGKNIIPMLVLALVAVALCAAIWYVVNTFIIKDETSVPAANSTSISESVSSQADETVVDEAVVDDTVVDETTQAEPTGNNDSVVHPFA